MKKMIHNEMAAHRDILERVMDGLGDEIADAARLLVTTLKEGNKVLFCGNGGSAADAQHLAAEISGRFETVRVGLPALALTTDSSVLTAISNDMGYEMVFARQVEAFASKGDLLVGISTSGTSPNVLKAFEEARKAGCRTVGLSGRAGGDFAGNCDMNLVIPVDSTARIQEMHILIGHILCKAVDQAFEENK